MCLGSLQTLSEKVPDTRLRGLALQVRDVVRGRDRRHYVLADKNLYQYADNRL